MAAEAKNRPLLQDVCSLSNFKCPRGEGGIGSGGGGGGSGRFSWKFCSLCWQTDVADYRGS